MKKAFDVLEKMEENHGFKNQKKDKKQVIFFKPFYFYILFI